MVLWHLEVENQKPADIAPLLGMSANSVSALAYRAREGLRQAFLNMHSGDLVSDACRDTNDLLGGYVRQRSVPPRHREGGGPPRPLPPVHRGLPRARRGQLLPGRACSARCCSAGPPPATWRRRRGRCRGRRRNRGRRGDRAHPRPGDGQPAGHRGRHRDRRSGWPPSRASRSATADPRSSRPRPSRPEPSPSPPRRARRPRGTRSARCPPVTGTASTGTTATPRVATPGADGCTSPPAAREHEHHRVGGVRHLDDGRRRQWAARRRQRRHGRARRQRRQGGNGQPGPTQPSSGTKPGHPKPPHTTPSDPRRLRRPPDDPVEPRRPGPAGVRRPLGPAATERRRPGARLAGGCGPATRARGTERHGRGDGVPPGQTVRLHVATSSGDLHWTTQARAGGRAAPTTARPRATGRSCSACTASPDRP